MMGKNDTRWFPRVARLMAQEHYSFQSAISELGVPLSTQESAKIERSADFKRVLETEQNKYFEELAQNPAHGKGSVVGEMLWCVRQLVREGQFEKAMDGLYKIARIEGHVGGDATVNVLAGITQKDIEEAKKTLKIEKEPEIVEKKPLLQ